MPFILFICFISQALAQPWGDLYGNTGDIYVTNKDRSDRKAGYVIRGNQNAWWIYKNGTSLDFNFASTTGDTDRGNLVVKINPNEGAIFADKRVKVGPGNGNGFALWGGGDAYKIHMGNTSEYHYGGVTDFAIKTNMDDDNEGRGWVWGAKNKTPVAALTNSGSLRLKENLHICGETTVDNEMIVGSTLRAKDIKVNAGVYNGYAFDNSYYNKIYMGYGNEFNYGAVTASSIKTSIQSYDSGYTWGVKGEEPIASLSNTGIFQIKDDFIAEGEMYVKELHVGEEMQNKIDNVKLSVDGRVYVSERGSKGRGLLEVEDNSNYDDYLLWVEEGVASVDFALAPVDEWPDYVFDSEYKLPSLKQVENTILEKGHLHTMPSAEEVDKKGFVVSDITKRLLQTIEELTLHTIAQEKKIDVLRARLKDLEEE
ncbi:MAG: hypothetical protein ACPH2K_03160 [Flavicella sp.]